MVDSIVTKEPANRITVRKDMAEELIRICVGALPKQAYGLVGGEDLHHPSSLYPCSTNLRNTPEWRTVFESFGEFYRDPDRGFVIAPEELLFILNRMRARDESLIGVFHSHRWHGPVPTQADLTLHDDPNLFSYIVSVVSHDSPELKIYRIYDSQFVNMAIQII